MDHDHDALLGALRELTRNEAAQFHPGQREAIESLAIDHDRLVLVQRTGWGKSAVYFVATHLLRRQGFGPTLLISPLLALMRNQMDAASRLGLRTFSINSSSDSTVEELAGLLKQDEVDVVVISPERLANPAFGDIAMPLIGRRPGLTVIDEVHCISDWGHDFRPDYQRIGRMLAAFPANMPILGCTATANQRVIDDARRQLGHQAKVQRGPLGRDGLALAVHDLPRRADRLAWLSQHVNDLPGAGIVYCLTTRDVDVVSGWLLHEGISARPYYGGRPDEEKLDSEERLRSGELKVLVATSALGMGYDNPEIGFVVHFQSPGSVVHYYQQVGRAGRALDQSVGAMLVGEEDRQIVEWFHETAFPTEEQVDQVLHQLDETEGELSISSIAREVNLKHSQIESVLKQLEVAGAVRGVSGRSYARSFGQWVYPSEHVEELGRIRRAELEEMERYAKTSGCRMRFLVDALDDGAQEDCGICDNCQGNPVAVSLDPERVAKADAFLDRQYGTIEPRKRGRDGRNIPVEELVSEGRYLCSWNDGGYGQLVRRGKQQDGRFSNDLVEAMAILVERWELDPRPTGVTYVPSLNHPELVADLAERLAIRLGLTLVDAVERSRPGPPQKSMQNSSHQAKNVDGAFSVKQGRDLHLESTSMLLLDDLVDSRWTMTEVGKILRQAGVHAVFPLALASSTSS